MSKTEIVLVLEDGSEDKPLPRITWMQYTLLHLISLRPGICAYRASVMLGRTYSSVYGSVWTLVRLGFVERQKDPYLLQSKGIPLFVTDAGLRHLKVLEEAGI